MVHRLTSEMHDMTPDQQDFVMCVLGEEEPSLRALEQLSAMCEKFEV